MSSVPVASRPAPPMIRLVRLGMAAVGRFYGWRRKPTRPPTPAVEASYGADPAERIDYLAPREGVPRRAPVIYIHGGGWIIGDKETYDPFLGFLCEAGHPVFNVEYPLAPENPHPGILRSLFRALDWVQSNHPEVEGYHAMGDSAGGNLAMMLGLLARNPGLVTDVDPARTAGLPLTCHTVISLYGVLDRLTWVEDGFPGADMMLDSYAGAAGSAPEVGPELAITPIDLAFEEAPPSLLTVGTEDPLLRSSRLLAERLGQGSAKVRLREYPGEPHGFFNFGKSSSAERMNADILDFLTAEDPATA